MRLDIGLGWDVFGGPMGGRDFPGAIPLNGQILLEFLARIAATSAAIASS
jgi:hypothetical protein